MEPVMLEEDEEEEEEASNPGLRLVEREKGPGKPSSTERDLRVNKACEQDNSITMQALQTWIFLIYTVRLWSISIQSFLTAPCFPRNHLIISGISTVPLG